MQTCRRSIATFQNGTVRGTAVTLDSAAGVGTSPAAPLNTAATTLAARSTPGGGVFVALLLACVNTMLMAAREQTHDVGILKSLGFTDGSVFWYFVVQSLVLCGLGGGLGIALALATQGPLEGAMGRFFPGYAVLPATVGAAVGVALLLGFLAGVMPARQASRLKAVDVLRTLE